MPRAGKGVRPSRRLIRGRWLWAVALSCVLVAGCSLREYSVDIPTGVQTRLPVEAAAGLGQAKLAEWETQARIFGHEIRTAPRILSVSVNPNGFDVRSTREHIPGPIWIIEAQGTFLFTREGARPAIGDGGTMVFEDATGRMLAWSGTSR